MQSRRGVDKFKHQYSPSTIWHPDLPYLTEKKDQGGKNKPTDHEKNESRPKIILECFRHHGLSGRFFSCQAGLWFLEVGDHIAKQGDHQGSIVGEYQIPTVNNK